MNIYNYNHLFYFYVTAKLNGVTEAAKHLNTSQSSLSTQIKTLETTINRQLFKKSGRRMELTNGGKELFNYCRRAFEVFDEMFDQINRTNSSMGVRISIGVAVDIEKPFVTDALSKATKQYKKEQRPLLNLVSLPASQLRQLLIVGEIDFLLTTSSGIDDKLESLGDFNFPVSAFTSPSFAKNRPAGSINFPVHEKDAPFVLPSHLTGLRHEIDTYLIRKKVNPSCVFESNIISSVIRAATDGMGITVLPYVYVARELRSERLISISPKPLWKHKMSLVTTRQKLDEGRRSFAEKLSLCLKESSEQSLQSIPNIDSFARRRLII
jgi:LysR family transcriptional regulator, transcriptional activator of nhaA